MAWMVGSGKLSTTVDSTSGNKDSGEGEVCKGSVNVGV